MTQFRQGKRRRMKKFVIHELSAVDNPAQEGARALLVKRADDAAKNCDEERAIVLLTSSEDGHSHAVWIHPGTRGGETSFGRDPGKDSSHDHPWILTGVGQILIGENDGHAHTVDAQQVFEVFMSKRDEAHRQVELVSDEQLWNDYACKFETGSHQEDDMADRTPEQEAVKKAEDKVTELETQLLRAGKLAELTDAQKVHFNDLDETGQTAYLGKSAAERQADIEKLKVDDPVIYTDSEGREFRKSDDPRLVSMAKEREADRKELIKARTLREQDSFEKRATAELTHLPGEVKVRAAIIKAIDGIEDETVRKSAHESVQAGSKAIKAAFDTVGTTTSVETTDAERELDRLAKELAAKESINYFDAYQKVSDSNPELSKRAVTGS